MEFETAASQCAPVIIQFSNGGAQFNAGKALTKMKKQQLQVVLQAQNTFIL
jgi:fructose/tagatose bisphosphate aldolase